MSSLPETGVVDAQLAKDLEAAPPSNGQNWRKAARRVGVATTLLVACGVVFVAAFGHDNTRPNQAARLLEDEQINLGDFAVPWDEEGEVDHDDEARRVLLRGFEDARADEDDDMAAEEEGNNGRQLKRRRKRGKSTPRPTMSPIEMGDVPDSGCNTMRNQDDCQVYDNCEWKSKKCVHTAVAATRVLFIGNSFTIRNSLPSMFQSLAREAGHNAMAYMVAAGSMSFNSHSKSLYTESAIKAKDWETVVLQEQSAQLSYANWYSYQKSVPFAKALYEKAKSHARTVTLYQTWGYSYGNPSFLNDIPSNSADESYAYMQTRLTRGYDLTAKALAEVRAEGDAEIVIAPVGEAWRLAFPKLENKLYDADGRHPKATGTYLAACVMFARTYGESPVGLKYRGKGVSKSDATLMQRYAAQIVLG